ncbi:MAG TPA: Mut7-C RNAse domain-containing protein, partial [Labilithrix sp.]|nr:Mut7-C RNAse domain-containing protein [Labilithrix sp.]
LPTGEPRCMACGGELREIAKQDAVDRAPPRSFAAFERFWTCAVCNKLFWHGTHWARIVEALDVLQPPKAVGCT